MASRSDKRGAVAARTRSPRPAPRPSIGDELEAASAALRRAGVSSPDHLALRTWSSLARTTPGGVWRERSAAPPGGDLVFRFRDAIARQAAGEPFQYTVNLAGFRLLDLFVDRRVLIPRSETEGLVAHVLERALRHPRGVVADIGTGSGAIALALASEGSFDRVLATDVSRDAIDVARLNLASVAPVTPVEFRQGSLLEPLAGRVVDAIVSNPPYVSSSEWRGLMPLVRDFEPRLALDGGPDGLTPTRTLLRDAAAHLAPGGLLALEIDSTRGAQTLDIARECGWHHGCILPDAAGRDRYFLATRSG